METFILACILSSFELNWQTFLFLCEWCVFPTAFCCCGPDQLWCLRPECHSQSGLAWSQTAWQYTPKINITIHRKKDCGSSLWWRTKRTILKWVSKVNSGMFWFCVTSLCDWSRKLTPSSQQIRRTTKTNLDLDTHIFPRIWRLACFYLSSHWPIMMLTFVNSWSKRIIVSFALTRG